MDIQRQDYLAALQLIIEGMPDRDDLELALSLRADSIDASTVCNVIDVMRMELYVRAGNVAWNDHEPVEVSLPQSSGLERKLAYQLLLAHLPDDAVLAVPVRHRRDGSSVQGVRIALQNWHHELSSLIDNTPSHR
ncbi:hypothetical protein [Burkholderia sp. Bp9012]|uniref:hypothetical protein n=1 Tax=Burkholderia sp. Bp9012 TaxID=2184562 RepID=UPI000F5A7E39|nr:hypothetical protein [Burkholderia sp. Bp9012]